MIITVALAAAFFIFLTGITIRVVRIAAKPMHVRWELYPIPESAVRKMCVMASEVLLLKGVFHHHRSLWLWSWLFHVSLYGLIGVAGLSVLALVLGHKGQSITMLIGFFSLAAYACGAIGTGGLILARISSRRLRPFTSFASLFNLSVLLAIFITGMVHAIFQPLAAQKIIAVAECLLRFGPPPPLHPVAVAHLGLMAFFVAYFPFTQMTHALLKYFTYHSVLWNDQPQSMSRYLAYPIRWSAPHIHGGSAKAKWSEVIKFEK
jgi:nitrate reductase gamma subunit